MDKRFWQEDIECMPLEELAKLEEHKLTESNLLERAQLSAIYRERWREAGIEPKGILCREDLKKIPFTTGTDLKKAYEENEIDEIICSRKVRLWSCTSGTSGTPKWIPYADGDIAMFEQLSLRNRYVWQTQKVEHKLFVLTTPAPFISSTGAYLRLLAQILNGVCVESIQAAITGAEEALELVRSRKVDIFFAFPSVAMKIAEVLAEKAPEAAKQRFSEKKNLNSLVAMLAAKTMNITPKRLFNFKHGIFSGEPLDPYRKDIIDAWGIEPFEVYAFTEFPCINLECREHEGIHLWMDTCIPEIIPQEELEKEEANPSYMPETLFLDEARPGITGEYVVTTFGEALPLIRYRTSDLIRIVSTEPCGCGRTHPRIKVIRRIDDVVNMGLIRFSTFELEVRLSEVHQNGKVDNWQLRLEREGYKPKLVLLVKPSGVTDKSRFLAEVEAKTFEVKTLQLGLATGMIAQPDIRLVEGIKERRTLSNKLRRVVYDE